MTAPPSSRLCRLVKAAAVLTAAAFALSACGASSRGTAALASTNRARGPVTKVLTLVLENHGQSATLAGMPQLAKLATTYGRTTHYQAATHPSLPNYLTLAGGSAFGVHDDKAPSAHSLAGLSVFDQGVDAGRSARTYAEAMPGSCALAPSGRYAVKHNPWAYFSDPASRRACQADDVPAGTTTSGALHDDIAAGRLPAVGLLVPDLCNDAHDCPLAVADTWVAAWTSQLMKGPDYRSGRLALVVTFDEAENGGDNTVLTVVAAPGVRGAVVSTPLTHLSWSAWMSRLAGAGPLREAAGAPSLGQAFGL